MDERAIISYPDPEAFLKKELNKIKRREAEHLLQLGRECFKSNDSERAKAFFSKASQEYGFIDNSLDTATWVASTMCELADHYFERKHYRNARGFYTAAYRIFHSGFYVLQAPQLRLLLFVFTRLCLIDYAEEKKLEFYAVATQIFVKLEKTGLPFDKERREFAILLAIDLEENHENNTLERIDFLIDVLRKIHFSSPVDEKCLAYWRKKRNQLTLTDKERQDYEETRNKLKELTSLYDLPLDVYEINCKYQEIAALLARIPDDYKTPEDWIALAQHFDRLSELCYEKNLKENACHLTWIVRNNYLCRIEVPMGNRAYPKLVLYHGFSYIKLRLWEHNPFDFYPYAVTMKQIFIRSYLPFEAERRRYTTELYELANYFFNSGCHQMAVKFIQLGIDVFDGIETKTQDDKKLLDKCQKLKAAAQLLSNERETVNQQSSPEDIELRNSGLYILETAAWLPTITGYLNTYISTIEKIKVKSDYDRRGFAFVLIKSGEECKQKNDEGFLDLMERALFQLENIERKKQKDFREIIQCSLELCDSYNNKNNFQKMRQFLDVALKYTQQLQDKDKLNLLRNDKDFLKLLNQQKKLVQIFQEQEKMRKQAEKAARRKRQEEEKRLRAAEVAKKNAEEVAANKAAEQQRKLASLATAEKSEYDSEVKKFTGFYSHLRTFEECRNTTRNRSQKWEEGVDEKTLSVPERKVFDEVVRAYASVIEFCERIINLCHTASGYQQVDIVKLRACNKECDSAKDILKTKKEKLTLAEAEWKKTMEKRKEKEKDEEIPFNPSKLAASRMWAPKKKSAQPKAPPSPHQTPPRAVPTEAERQARIDELFARVELEEEPVVDMTVVQPFGEKLEKTLALEFEGSATRKKETVSPQPKVVIRPVVFRGDLLKKDCITPYIEEELNQLRAIVKDKTKDFGEHQLIRQRDIHYRLVRIHLVLAEVYKRQEEENYKAILANVDPLLREADLGRFADHFCNFLMHRYRAVTYKNIIACANSCYGQAVNAKLPQRVQKTALFRSFTESHIAKTSEALISDCEKIFNDLVSFDGLRFKLDNHSEHPAFLNACRMTLMIMGEVRARLHEVCPELKNEKFERNDPLARLLHKLEQCRLWRNPEKHESDIDTIYLSFETGNPFVVERILPKDVDDFMVFAKDIMANHPGVFKALENKVGNLLTPNVEEAVVGEELAFASRAMRR